MTAGEGKTEAEFFVDSNHSRVKKCRQYFRLLFILRPFLMNGRYPLHRELFRHQIGLWDSTVSICASMANGLTVLQSRYGRVILISLYQYYHFISFV